MRHWKRLFYYLIINVIVSACTVVTVLTIWERLNPDTPILSQLNPLALITPMSPRELFPSFVTPEPTENPKPIALVATETPSESAAETPQMTELEYAVESGDTLGAIAVKFDITVAEIMEANEIADPDQLVVGQVLIIRRSVVGVNQLTALPPEDLETGTQATSPIPATSTPPPLTGESQVMIDSVIGAGDLESERVFLKRVGPGEISMSGWQLVSDGGDVYNFPQITLFENGAVYVYTRNGPTTAVTLYWELDYPVWESGATVELRDDQGQVHDSYTIP
jgi:LysM repeat protein